MNRTRGLDTVIIYTRDIHSLSDFYAAGLGLAEPNQVPGHIGYHLPRGLYLGFDQGDDRAVGRGGVSLWFDVDDLEAAFERFVSLGATVRYPPQLKPMGDVLASLVDPDGNVFGLVCR